jgi:hypothetical protein
METIIVIESRKRPKKDKLYIDSKYKQSKSSDECSEENLESSDECSECSECSDENLTKCEKPIIIENFPNESKKDSDSDSLCNSDCGCGEDCNCKSHKKCPKFFPKRPHGLWCKECEKCKKWDSNIPIKPHKKWGCDCDQCQEWIDAYFLILHPENCNCKYCEFICIKTKYFSY